MIKEDARWVLGVAAAAAAAGMIGCGVVQWRAPAVDPYVAKPIGPGVITKQNTVSTDTTPSGATYNIQLPDGKSVGVEDVSPPIYYALGVPGAKVACPDLSVGKSPGSDLTVVINLKSCITSFPQPLTVTAATDNYSKHNDNQAVFTVEHGKRIGGTLAINLPKAVVVKKGEEYRITLGETNVPVFNFMGYNQGVDLTAQDVNHLPQRTR